MTRQITFVRMKKNPNNVTMLGASHSGKSSTNAFHYNISAKLFCCSGPFAAHIVFEDIIRNQGLVDTRILVGLEMDESFFRHALMCDLLYYVPDSVSKAYSYPDLGYVLLPGDIGDFGVVTGAGSKARGCSVFTASNSRGRMVNGSSRIALRPRRCLAFQDALKYIRQRVMGHRDMFLVVWCSLR
jgi:hypothetical protein